MKASEIVISVLTVVLSIIALVNALIAYYNVKRHAKEVQEEYIKISERMSFNSHSNNKIQVVDDKKHYFMLKERIQQKGSGRERSKNTIPAFY